MLSICCSGIPRQGNLRQTIELQESNLLELLVRWLSEINFLLMVHHFLPVGILQLHIKEIRQNYQLHAVIDGCDSRQQAESIRIEIKAVTYHQLRLEQNEQGYSARIIFDL
jgi:SHS2 domain-containing protein